MSHVEIARKLLVRNEGLRLKPYKDTKGIWTIGVGHNLEANPLPGRTMFDIIKNGITEEQAYELLDQQIAVAENDARLLCPMFFNFNDVRRAVMIDLAYNLGRTRLSGFKKFLKAVYHKEFETAGFELLDSRYTHDVGARAYRNAIMMVSGKFL